MKISPLSTLFPQNVYFAEADPSAIKGKLHPDEEIHIANAILKRQNEFKAGRLLAKSLLEKLNIYNFPLRVNKNRMPAWPKGICGSISHTDDYCGVVIAKTKNYKSIGFDVERLGRIKEKLWPTVLTNDEIEYINNLRKNERNNYATLIFSAKESFFKMQYPLTRKFINFHDVGITVERNKQSFELIQYCPSKTPFKKKSLWKGHYAFSNLQVFTGMLIKK